MLVISCKCVGRDTILKSYCPITNYLLFTITVGVFSFIFWLQLTGCLYIPATLLEYHQL